MANKRNYLIFEDVKKDTSLQNIFDTCTSMILDGSARITKTKAEKGYPQYDCFKVENREVLVNSAFEYYLYRLGVSGFNYEKAHAFTERMLKLSGFSFDVRYPLGQWVERCLRNPYFCEVSNNSNAWGKKWVLNTNEVHDFIPEDYFKFACYIAVCYIKYGSDDFTSNQIFGYVSALGSKLPEFMKKNGSGELPKNVTEYSDDTVFCKANDAFGTIKIVLKSENETAYAKVLDFLCCLLENNFPRSYSIDFRSPNKNYLPIKGLPKKGIHQLFANAVQYTALHNKIEKYAYLAMREFEWYSNLNEEDCAMPGTFAVFALGLYAVVYAPLVLDYLDLCDDEHSGIQGKFITAYIEKFGFTESSLKVFFAGAGSMQELPPNKIYTKAIANEDNLRLLLTYKKNSNEYVWRAALYALWGKDSVYNKTKILKSAPSALRTLYEEILS